MSKLDPRQPAARARPAIAAVERVLAAHEEVRWAYLFGSAARGEDHRDLDVAVFASEGSLPGMSFLALGAELERAAGMPVDLVDLRVASLELQAETRSTGRLLLDRDPAMRRRFEVEARTRWLDFAPALELHRRLLRRRLQEPLHGR